MTVRSNPGADVRQPDRHCPPTPAAWCISPGYSLLELIAVLAIVAIAALALMPVYSSYSQLARQRHVQAELIHQAARLEQSYNQQQGYPTLRDYAFPATRARYTISMQRSANGYVLSATPLGVQRGSGRLELYSNGERRLIKNGQISDW